MILKARFFWSASIRDTLVFQVFMMWLVTQITFTNVVFIEAFYHPLCAMTCPSIPLLVVSVRRLLTLNYRLLSINLSHQFLFSMAPETAGKHTVVFVCTLCIALVRFVDISRYFLGLVSHISLPRYLRTH